MRRHIPVRSDSQDTKGQAWNLPAEAVTGACMTGQEPKDIDGERVQEVKIY